MDTINQIEAQLIMRHYEGFTPRAGPYSRPPELSLMPVRYTSREARRSINCRQDHVSRGETSAAGLLAESCQSCSARRDRERERSPSSW